jgi:hypothetical protein
MILDSSRLTRQSLNFRQDSFGLGGFASIKKKRAGEIWGTPLIIGLWTSPEARAFMDALSAH